MRTLLCIYAGDGELTQAVATLGTIPLDGFDDAFIIAVDGAKAGRECVEITEVNARVTFLKAPPDASNYWSTIVAHIYDGYDRVLVVDGRAKVSDRLHLIGDMILDGVAAIFPLTTKHPFSRAFMQAQPRPGLTVKDIDGWLNRFAIGQPIEVPGFAGTTAWLNMALLRSLVAGDDGELATRLRQSGGSLIVTDEAFVDDSLCELPSTCSVPPAVTEALATRHPYTALRHPLTELSQRGETPPAALRRGPRAVLHISHSWGGGLARWISDFCLADNENIQLVLRSIGDWDASGKSLALYDGAHEGPPIKTWTLTTPILASAVSSFEYRKILKEISESFSLKVVMVSTLIGHSLDVYAMGAPAIHVFHDFYPWCPPLYATWETPCKQCDRGRLATCLRENSAHQFFQDAPHSDFPAIREQFVACLGHNKTPMVFPSASVRERWYALAPSLPSEHQYLIEHGLPQTELTEFLVRRTDAIANDQLHIVVLGSLAPHKGGKLLAGIMHELVERFKVTLLGCGDDAPNFEPHHNLTMIPRYQRDDLPALLSEIKPDLGLLLSLVPETFSYTLSELFAAAIPPVATRRGALEDRIEDGVSGWLVSPEKDALLATLRALAADVSAVSRVRRRLLSVEPKSVADMIGEYYRLLPSTSGPSFRPRIRWGERLVSNEMQVTEALHIRSDARYKDVLRQFIAYSRAKAEASPRLKGLTRWIVLLVLARAGRF